MKFIKLIGEINNKNINYKTDNTKDNTKNEIQHCLCTLNYIKDNINKRHSFSYIKF